jgi:hypothetical protein
MQELFDVGYMEIGDVKTIKKAVDTLGAVLLDVRYSPRSRNPQYNKSYLEKLFNTTSLAKGLDPVYVPVKILGNKNYKGTVTEFEDLAGGLALIASHLETRPVIIMCGCWKRIECHRLEIANAFQVAYGVGSIPLTRELCKDLAARLSPKQLDIFGEGAA